MYKKVFTDYMSTQFSVAENVREVMRSIKEKVPEELYYRMCDSLVGFKEDLQLAMAANLKDAVNFGFERYTFIDHVDDLLKGFYLAIDRELDRI